MGRGRISALQERFNTWTYQAINRLQHNLAALRKNPSSGTLGASKPPGEDPHRLAQRVALLEDRLLRLEGGRRELESGDNERRPCPTWTRKEPTEFVGDEEHASGRGRGPAIGSSVFLMSPLEAWLTGEAPPSFEQAARDPLGPEPLLGLTEDDVAIPREAIDLQFLARTER